MSNPFQSRATLETKSGPKTIFRLDALRALGDIDQIPYSIKILLEACLRNVGLDFDRRGIETTGLRLDPGYQLTQVAGISCQHPR